MDAAPDGVAEEQDDEPGIDQQDVLYRMVLFLATVTVRLFSSSSIPSFHTIAKVSETTRD